MKTRFLFLAALFTSLLAFTALSAYSCDCRAPSVQQEFENARTVFIGEFIGYGKERIYGRRYSVPRFRVNKLWKAEIPPEVNLQVWDVPGCSKDLNLVKGTKYLIYVTTYKDSLIAIVDCGHSNELKHASESLQFLGGIESKTVRKD